MFRTPEGCNIVQRNNDVFVFVLEVGIMLKLRVSVFVRPRWW